jgi:hypothetical protein
MKLLACAALVIAAVTLTAAQAPAVDLERTLALAGERVQSFFTRAQSLICTEIVTLQPLGSGLAAEGFGRTVESELRLSWNPKDDGTAATEAQTLRQVIKVNGAPPRNDDHRRCTTPEQTDTERQPLSMLLLHEREKYRFSLAGSSRAGGRAAIVIDYREVAPAKPDVSAVDGLEDCISYELNGGQAGRVWIDAETHDVLRLDERLIGMVDLRLPRPMWRRPGNPMFLTLERADTSLRFGRVSFSQPDESLLLPVESSEFRILRGGGISRLRTTTRYLQYKRFLTGSRVVTG